MFDTATGLLALLPLTLGLLIAAVIVHGFLVRARLELRSQILELLALATKRSSPLPPLFVEAAHETHGRRSRLLSRIGERLASGMPLADALAAVSTKLFPEHIIATIRVADGSAELPGLLFALATDVGRGELAWRRFALTATYPVLLALLLWGVQSAVQPVRVATDIVMTKANDGDARWATSSLMFVTMILVTTVFALFVAAWVARVAVGGRSRLARAAQDLAGRLPLARLLGAERALRAMSAAIAARTPLSEALLRAAPASGHPAIGDDLSAAASFLGEGAPIEEVWQRTRLPAFAVVRASAASGRNASRLASTLHDLADDCAERFQQMLRRTEAWVLPIALLSFGAVLTWHFHAIMTLLSQMREVATKW